MIVDKKNKEYDESKDSKIHKGHRGRLKKQVILNGIDNWPEHQVLEFLLFFGVPQRNTNEIAHNLIATYGSLINVFNASFDSLTKIKGVGNNIATLIILIPKLFRYIENMKVEEKSISFQNSAQVARYMTPKFYNLTHEILYVLAFDNKQKLISADIILEGVVNRINIDNRKIVEAVILNHASNIILCHNHPSGFCAPSYDDIVATKCIIEYLGSMGVTILDHIIISDNEYCSMMDMEYIKRN